jgi:predicted nuclease of predicted toxin-antitoxin system
VKVLIDECLPVDLRFYFPGHDCITVQYLGAKGAKDSGLLHLIASEQIDVLLTIDGNMRYQQNFRKHPRLAVIFLSAPSNDIRDLLPLVPSIRDTLQGIKPGQHIRVQ